MQLQHSPSESAAVTETAGVVAEALDRKVSRVAELEQARNADRIWRAGRKAEIDRLLKRGLIQFIVASILACTLVQMAIHALVIPYLIQRDSSWLGIFGSLGQVLLPPLVVLLLGTLYGRWMRPLLDERKAYEEKPGNPVVWSSGLVIYPPTSEEQAGATPQTQIPDGAVVWSTGTMITPPKHEETPP